LTKAAQQWKPLEPQRGDCSQSSAKFLVRTSRIRIARSHSFASQ